MEKIIFKYDYTESGFCRVHFKTKHPKGHMLFYCIMEETKDTVGFYRCTQDGEPSHTVSFSCEVEIETPPDEYGQNLLKIFNEGERQKWKK